MRRTVIIASCLTALCLAALAIWVFLKSAKQDAAPAPEVSNRDNPVNTTPPGAAEKAARSSIVSELPGRNALLGDDEFVPFYFDLETKTLYPWRGVALRREQVPNPGRQHRSPVLTAKDFSVVPFDAPVKYWEINGKYRPGYLDRTDWVFYEWKGVVLAKRELLDKSPDGQDAVVKLAFPGRVISVSEIDMPAHLKDHPELWKKS